jgi:O-antigen ligase
VGIIVLLLLHRRFALAIKSFVVLIPVIVCCWLALPQESKDYAVDFSHSASNIEARYQSADYALKLFDQSPVWGNGVGLRKTYDATNVILSTLAETGVAGLVAFLSIFIAMFWMVIRTCRTADPKSHVFSIAAIAGALMAAKFAHGCVDHYWSRVMLPVWAAAGMGVYSYNRVRTLGRQKAAVAIGRQ